MSFLQLISTLDTKNFSEGEFPLRSGVRLQRRLQEMARKYLNGSGKNQEGPAV
jgi:hypothetical protein